METRIITFKKGQRYFPKGFQLPSGRIDKNYTGIGATQCEIENEARNSIIVVPTRALAVTKAIKHQGLHYGGGSNDYIASSKPEQLTKEIRDGKRVKVICVADTFVLWFRKDPSLFLGNFFLLLDEADSYQSESSYREILEDVIDIFFEFPENQRAMITATLQQSAYEKINELPLTEIKKEDYKIPGISLVNVRGSLTAYTAKAIKNLVWKSRDTKILVALNSITMIKEIIALADFTEKECSILCSENSKGDVGKFFGTLNNGKLSKKVTFITSAYFSGIDIEERLNVYVVSDCRSIHTPLTKAKISQIFGRARKGCTNRTFIFNVNPVGYSGQTDPLFR